MGPNKDTMSIEQSFHQDLEKRAEKVERKKHRNPMLHLIPKKKKRK